MYAGVCLYTFGLSKTGNAFLPRKAGKKFVFLSSFRFSEKNERYFFFYRTFVRPRGWFRVAKPPLNGVAETEYTKSQQGGLTPSSFRTTGGVHELVARVMRGKYVRQMAKRKSAVSRSPQSHLYHASEHTTRESRADSCTHCLHARIYRWELTDSRSERGRRRRDRGAGVNLICALTG